MSISLSSCRQAFLMLIPVFVISVLPSSAVVEFTQDEAQFLADSPGLSFQDFSGTPIAFGRFTLCTAPVDENTSDNCFTPGQILPGIAFADDPLTPLDGLALLGENFIGVGNPPNVLVNNRTTFAFLILFSDPGINRVGMNIGCLAGRCTPGTDTVPTTVVIYGPGGVQTGSASVDATSEFDTFLGVSSDEPITRISLDSEVDRINGVRNVWFGTFQAPPPPPPVVRQIPAMSEWGMIAAAAGFAIVGAFYALRRKRASA